VAVASDTGVGELVQANENNETPLPDDLEQAALEQVGSWFMNRDKLGLDTTWPHAGTYEKLTQSNLLLDVKAVLKRPQRWAA
jgi:hypothetical protein